MLKTEDNNNIVNWVANDLVCKVSESIWKLLSKYSRVIFCLTISSKHYQFTVNLWLIDQAQFVTRLLFLFVAILLRENKKYPCSQREH